MPKEYQDYLDFMSQKSSRRPSGGNESEGDGMFWEILKERRVTSKWTWEETLRAIITHPNYKCIPTLQERKLSFQRYCEAMRSVEEEEARLQSLAIKEAFKALLAEDSQINSDTKWSEVVDKHGRNPAFLAVPSSRERVQLFEEFQSELRRSELESVWARRKASSQQISELLKELNVSLDFERGRLPDWHDVKDKLMGLLPGVDPIEYLLSFEEHVQELMKEYQATRRAEKQAELLKEMQLREAFNGLLKELIESEQFTPLSTWTSVYPLIRERPEYKNLVSIYIYGSSPIDMFYDHLDRMQDSYNVERMKIASYFKKEFMTTEAVKLPKIFASFTQFKETLRTALNLEGPSVKYAFTELYGPEAVALDRNRINAYKHLLKHINPPIKLSETWTEAKNRLKGKEEYEAVECEEDRELYFLKFKKWLSKHEEGPAEPKRSKWDRKDEKEEDEGYGHGNGYGNRRSKAHDHYNEYDSRSRRDRRY